jgi:hypothetical protein
MKLLLASLAAKWLSAKQKGLKFRPSPSDVVDVSRRSGWKWYVMTITFFCLGMAF